MLSRRRFLRSSSAAIVSSLALPWLARADAGAAATVPADAAITVATDFAALERACAGRLGVTLLDTASGRRIGHRQDERFPMCSTVKTMLVATVLDLAERTPALLDRRVAVREADLLPHAPVARRHAGKDLTVRNDVVYLKTFGGLERVDVILRRLDDVFCDPLELRSDSTIGVPGLLEAMRAGNVMVSNVPGSGFLESPAIHGFMPGMARALLGEPLRLPSVMSWWCGEASVWAP